MKKFIVLFMLSALMVSCYHEPFIYRRPSVLPINHAQLGSTPYREVRSVMISYDGGRTFQQQNIVVETNNFYQRNLVNNYFNGTTTPQWIASPTRAWLQSGGQFGQYLFPDSGINVFLTTALGFGSTLMRRGP